MSGKPGGHYENRCSAPVSEWQARATIAKRASGLTDRRCTRKGAVQAGGKWFCYAHAPLWRTHYWIVARIRSFPDRDIVT